MVLVLEGNTLVGLLPKLGSLFYLLAFLLCILVVFINWTRVSLSGKEVAGWGVWAAVTFTAYSVILFMTDDGGGKNGLISIAFFMACPLMVLLLTKEGKAEDYLRAFVNVVSVLALDSLVLWIAGPILNVMSANCSIPNGWTGTGEHILTEGYYHLLYVTQYSSFFGLQVVRNTGIFAEGPMYSYVLCLAILFETFFSDCPRRKILVILYVTVVTTMTTTGLVFVFIAGFLEVVRYVKTTKSDLRPLLIVFLVLLPIALGGVTFSLLDQKMGTSSGNIRIDDFYAGFAAWSGSPIYGHGLGSIDAAVPFMGDFRLYNTGFSNSLFDLLVKGGLVLFAPFVAAMIGLLFFTKKPKALGILFVGLWVVTIVTFQPLTLFVLSFGVASLWVGAKASPGVFRGKGLGSG